MKTIDYRFVDRTGWGSGPWDDEPDKVQWQDPKTGLPCLARRGPAGAWCGYVGVPKGHPLHGAHYDAVDADVHGGLTYSALCDGDDERGICHLPEIGEPEPVWWGGFDCYHLGDIGPAFEARMRKHGGSHLALYPEATYKPLDYVRGECKRLALQLGATP